ncbi:MAG: hypothetical protein PHW52_05120 [Candidatus Pacebacteria bacterium]|nr:hypothetical protein [Candidatus Paceibacterota bacterium]
MNVGILLWSSFFDYPISIYGYLLIIIAELFLGTVASHFFNSISRLRINISDGQIKKMNGKLSEEFLLSGIRSIKVKRRTNGMTREIYINFDDQKELVITAFEEGFESIENLIISKVGSSVPVREIREMVDFDHPLFYSILGFPISLVGILLMKILTGVSLLHLRYVLFAMSGYVLLIGIYFIIKKPTSIRSGRRQVAVDYMLGLIMICGSIFLFLVGLYR